MKKVLAGASVLLTGALFFLAVCTAASGLGLTGGWDERGRFLTAVSDNDLSFTLALSVLFCIAGAALLVWGLLEKDK